MVRPSYCSLRRCTTTPSSPDCAASRPIAAGSGTTDDYHRLHRGGDRQGTSALGTIS